MVYSKMKAAAKLVVGLWIALIGSSFPIVEARIQMKAYGSIVSTAYYYSDIFVGLPEPQRQSVILDTGSNLLAFSSTQCQQCGTHLDAYYDPLKSITKREVPCHSYCKVCVNSRKQCAYTIHYLEGSSLSGSYFEDFVSIRNEKGDTPEPSPYVVGLSTIFGGITHETNLFFTQAASGILGLAYTASSQERAPLFQTWTNRSKYARDAVLSLCFSSEGGMISFGGYNSEYWVLGSNDKSFRSTSDDTGVFTRLLGYTYLSSHTANKSHSNSKQMDSKIYWTPLSIINGNYHVKLITVSVHQTKVSLSKSSSGSSTPISLVIDSGTTLTYFPEHIFIQILNIINQRIAETENKSSFRSLVDAGSRLLEYAGFKSASEKNSDLGIRQISIFPGEIPGAALLRRRVYRMLNEVKSATHTFNSTIVPEDSIQNNGFSESDSAPETTPASSQYLDIDTSVSRILLETSKGERCWKLRDPSEMSRFPTITLGFPGLKVDWEPAQYLYKKYRNTYCLGFDSDKSFLVLGASFFINKDVILDVKNSRASFVKSNCPQIAHARRTSTSEMAQLLRDTSTSSPDSLMKSEVVVFDSNVNHHSVVGIDANNHGPSEHHSQGPNLSSGQSSSGLPNYRYGTDNETISESYWEPKNLTSPSSLSSFLSQSAAQYTGATNHSANSTDQEEGYGVLGSDILASYLKQKLKESAQGNGSRDPRPPPSTKVANSGVSTDAANVGSVRAGGGEVADNAGSGAGNDGVVDGGNGGGVNNEEADVDENGDDGASGVEVPNNKNSPSRYSDSQPTLVHWLVILLTAFISCYLFNGNDNKSGKRE